jgi:two-component system LytT family response regulator
MKIKCIAVDDEPLALDKMSTFIEKVPYLDLLGTFDNGFDAMNFLRQNKVDLMFLDIQMDELTGIQLLEVLTQRPKIILRRPTINMPLKAMSWM